MVAQYGTPTCKIKYLCFKMYKNERLGLSLVTMFVFMETRKKSLSTLGWLPLRERRARIKVSLLFQALNGLLEIPIHDLLSRQVHTRTRTADLVLPHSTVNSHLHSFYPDTIRLWNSLPLHIKYSPTLSSVKSSVSDGSTSCPTLRETN